MENPNVAIGNEIRAVLQRTASPPTPPSWRLFSMFSTDATGIAHLVTNVCFDVGNWYTVSVKDVYCSVGSDYKLAYEYILRDFKVLSAMLLKFGGLWDVGRCRLVQVLEVLKALQSFETSWTVYPTTQRTFSKESDFQTYILFVKYCCTRRQLLQRRRCQSLWSCLTSPVQPECVLMQIMQSAWAAGRVIVIVACRSRHMDLQQLKATRRHSIPSWWRRQFASTVWIMGCIWLWLRWTGRSICEGRLSVFQSHPSSSLNQFKSCVIRWMGLWSSMNRLRAFIRPLSIWVARSPVVLSQDFVVFLSPFRLSWIVLKIAYDLFLAHSFQLFINPPTIRRCMVCY